MVSPADLRYLKEMFRDFGLAATILPDYSDTLDGPAWNEYQRIPPGGTPIEAIRRMGGARATIEFGSTWDGTQTAGALLEKRFGVPRYELPLPIGVTQTDQLVDVLCKLAGRPLPERPRGRARPVDRFIRRCPQVCVSASGPWSMASRTSSSAWPRCWPKWA